MATTLADVLAFLSNEATFVDLDAVAGAHARRLRLLQYRDLRCFSLHERVLFVENGIECPALITRINRNTLTVCLDDGRHFRCATSYLRKMSSSSAPAAPHHACAS